MTTVNGNLQGYWYNEGYLRTSSKDFNLKNVQNRMVHLTNDAVQKKSDDYGKFESGNKVKFEKEAHISIAIVSRLLEVS
jgi:tubulin--tyrosine ligase